MRVKEKRDSSVTMFPQNDKESRMTNAGIAGKECRDKERLLQVAQATFVTTLKLSARNDKIK